MYPLIFDLEKHQKVFYLTKNTCITQTVTVDYQKSQIDYGFRILKMRFQQESLPEMASYQIYH